MNKLIEARTKEVIGKIDEDREIPDIFRDQVTIEPEIKLVGKNARAK